MNKYLTLNEYLENARRYIVGNASHLSENEDAISEVAHFMMKADEKFDSRGNMERSGFRGMYAKFGLQKYFHNIKKKKLSYKNKTGHSRMFSLDPYCNELHNLSIMKPIKYCKSDVEDPSTILEQKELVYSILNNNMLDERERSILTMRFMEQSTLQNIADAHGITRERVRQLLAKIIHRLKECYNVESV